MATSQATNVPGLYELFGDQMTFRDPKEVERAASNVHLPVVRGIEAIGELLWWAGQHEDFGKLDSTRVSIGSLGCLLQELGKLADIAHTAESNARYQLREKDEQFVEIPVVGRAV